MQNLAGVGWGGGGANKVHYGRFASGEWKLKYISNRKRVPCLNNLGRVGSIRVRRETKSRVCITVENSPNP